MNARFPFIPLDEPIGLPLQLSDGYTHAQIKDYLMSLQPLCCAAHP